VEEYFQDFMEFYFPSAAKQVDWTREYRFLNNELRQVVRDAELGRGRVDKLVEVPIVDGWVRWVYVHVEVQASRDADFKRRMFTYNYRIFDRYDRPVGSFAVLGDEDPKWRPEKFGYEVLGCRMQLDFPVVKLLDYEGGLESLLDQENVFALVTAAHLMTKKTRGDENDRLDAKFRLTRLLFERNWDRQRIIDLFAIIDWMMRLPDGLDHKFMQQLHSLEEEEKMQYVTSVERIAREQGWEDGLKEGRQEGWQEGRQEGEIRLLRRQLNHRFGELPDWVEMKLSEASAETIEDWAENLIEADSIEDVFEVDAG
jgi:hypothetical protein